MKLVADIGGTNSRIKVGNEYFEVKTKDFLVNYFNLKKKFNVKKVVLAIAAPITSDDEIKLSNNDVVIKKSDFSDVDFNLLNDVQAQGLALNNLKSEDVIRLDNVSHSGDVQALISVGTGLGASVISKKVVIPSELCYVDHKGKDFEHFVSGRGLSNIYLDIHGKKVSPSVAIKDKAVRQKFFLTLGTAARTYALCVMPLNGLYLAGGVISKNLSLFDKESFFKEFYKHSLMKEIPVYLVKPQDLGIRGCDSIWL